jgi:transcriptional regulator with XRE-family HTH domain
MAWLGHDPPDHASPALLSIIRRWHFRDEMPIREISRRTGLSRNTVRKYLRGGSVEPKFRVLDRPSKLAPHAEKLSLWLRADTTKSRKYISASAGAVQTIVTRIDSQQQPET